MPRRAVLRRRLRVQPGRIMAGWLRTIVIPCYVIAATTLLRPLAVEAPPPESVPAFLLEEPHYSGGTHAMRKLNELSEAWRRNAPGSFEGMSPLGTETEDACSFLDLSRDVQKRLRSAKWAAPETVMLERLLDRTAPLMSDMVAACMDESPVTTWDKTVPFVEEFPDYPAMVNWVSLEMVRRVDRGDVEGAMLSNPFSDYRRALPFRWSRSNGSATWSAQGNWR